MLPQKSSASLHSYLSNNRQKVETAKRYHKDTTKQFQLQQLQQFGAWSVVSLATELGVKTVVWQKVRKMCAICAKTYMQFFASVFAALSAAVSIYDNATIKQADIN